MEHHRQESAQEQLELRVKRMVQEWQQGPVVLASGSEFRANALRGMGFEHVSAIGVPDEPEWEEQAFWRKAAHAGFDDPKRQEVSKHVAAAKLEHLLKQGLVSEDALGIAADTMPMIYKLNDGPERKHLDGVWSAHQLTKPKHVEDVPRVMAETLQTVMEGFQDFLEGSGGFMYNRTRPLTEAQDLGLNALMKYGHATMRIRVNTGVALRPPHGKKIRVYSAGLNLLPHRLYRMQEGSDSTTVEELVDEILEFELDHDINPLKISGGIDYSRPEIRELLDIEEVPVTGKGFMSEEAKVDRGIYQGMPEAAQLMEIMERCAQDEVLEDVNS